MRFVWQKNIWECHTAVNEPNSRSSVAEASFILEGTFSFSYTHSSNLVHINVTTRGKQRVKEDWKAAGPLEILPPSDRIIPSHKPLGDKAFHDYIYIEIGEKVATGCVNAADS